MPYSRFAYETVDEQQIPLFDLFAGEGGTWVWRHDNGFRRDYFVGTKKVVQYFVKPWEEVMGREQARDRTIVGKQWVSKDVLEQAKYEWQEYGEGSYAITGKLNPVSPPDNRILHYSVRLT